MGFLMTLFGGPLVGLLGSLATGWFKGKEEERAAVSRQAEYDQEYRLQVLQGEQRSQDAENDLAIAQADAAARAVTASMGHDTALTAKESRWVTNTKALVRPALTGGLVALVGLMYFRGPGADASALQNEIATGILFLAEVAVTWWFGDRARASKR
tara:strand:- start:465 stop:932 length:468 start_codon:yes stop_codon:yes gene_type:complete